MRAALVQMTGSDAPDENLAHLRDRIDQAAEQSADIVLTPEVSNCVSLSRTRQREILETEEADRVLAGLREAAAGHGLWVLAGSLALRTDATDGRFANRSILIDAEGGIAARYDKIHMFDVEISAEESYRESAGFRPGDRAVLARTPLAAIGLTICYDLRFAALYRALARDGAQVLAVPSAFSPETGAAHWHTLLRARAIETGAWILAPAQTGRHPARRGRARRTYGHSLAVDPWGEVVADGGTDPGLIVVDLDLDRVAEARRRLPSLTHERSFTGP